jgi:flagellar biosynthesis protein FlhG
MLLSEIKLGQQDQAAALPGHGPVQTIAVTSGKGGVGKTNIAVNLALGLSKEGCRTMLLDADYGMANVDILLGLQSEVNLFDVLNGRQRLDEIIISGPDDLLIVPASSGIRELSCLGVHECAGIVRAFSEFDQAIDSLVIDTATGISECVASFCAASSEVLVVVNNEPASMQDSITLIRLLNSKYAIAHFHVVANMVLTATEGNELFHKLLTLLADDHNVLVSYAGYVPNDDALRKAVAQHKAVINAFPRSRSAMALRNLARRINHWPRRGHPRGHLEFFVERLLQHNNVDMEELS